MIRGLVTVVLLLVAMVISIARVQAHPAWGIAVDHQGQVYFSDLKTVWKVDARGKLSVFRAEDDRHTHELNVDETGNLYGVDNSYEPATQRFFNAVWKMTPAGNFSYLLAPTNGPLQGISIWVDRDGNMYSVEQNNQLKRETLLLRRTPGGNVSLHAGGSYGHADGKGSQAKFSNIVGIAFGSDGALYLTDSSSVRKVTMDGMVNTLARNIMVENAPGSPAGGSALFGIAVGAEGNAFVADYGNQRILKIARDGQMSTLIRAEESWFPTGVAVKGDEIYILEVYTPTQTGTRVRKLSPDGRVTTLASVGESTRSSGEPSDGKKSSGKSLHQNARYVLIGAGVGAFALALIVWRMRRKVHDRSS